MGGFSGYGEVVIHAEIDKLLVSIANHLDLIGSINVQLRFNIKGPCVFEINPRFSSTVRFRDLMGFHDVIWSLEDLLEEEISSYSIVAAGKKFYKGFSEYID
jgi:carbamoyl-phosphate synthase large subunit